MFITAMKLVELNIRWQYEMAQRQEKFMEDKLTYTVTGWNSDVDIFVDELTRFITVGDSKTQLS